MDYVQDVLLRLLQTPSPSGRTEDVMRLIGEELEHLAVSFYLTRRGVIVAGLDGQQESPDRAVVVHADTVGCVVKEIRPNGRLQVIPVGHFSARFAEGARVLVFPDDSPDAISGTVLPLFASGHTFGHAVDTQGVGWEHVEVRLDELTDSAEDTAALGIHVGDFVALEAQPTISASGFVNSRHLDDKAGVAACLGAFKAVIDADVELPVSAHLLVTIAEEVGLGASHGLHADVAEMVSVDNAVVAPGQASRETGVSIAMHDSSGPMDYHLTRKLIRLAEEHDIPVQRDVYNFYRSDAAAALESGAETRAALIGFGVDASHGYERTHLDAIQRIAELVALYLQTPLTFAWDATPRGPLEEFPSQE
ncbi:MAG: osmoprotectant NAGGN system M42 family peptidase, partial [Nitriliruptorales bacterium]|nr:osmoprotectant NAGGN system M42 family peptidase [Nitriliruptorales bacterium]